MTQCGGRNSYDMLIARFGRKTIFRIFNCANKQIIDFWIELPRWWLDWRIKKFQQIKCERFTVITPDNGISMPRCTNFVEPWKKCHILIPTLFERDNVSLWPFDSTIWAIWIVTEKCPHEAELSIRHVLWHLFMQKTPFQMWSSSMWNLLFHCNVSIRVWHHHIDKENVLLARTRTTTTTNCIDLTISHPV